MTINVVDFFSGCGGTSVGLQASGMNIVLGIDSDLDSGRTFDANFPDATMLVADIRSVGVDDIAEYLVPHAGEPLLFCGCAPCQPFSTQNRSPQGDDKRIPLLLEFARFVKHYLPDYVFVENVPGLMQRPEAYPFGAFLDTLKELGYEASYQVVFAQDYGVPQQRKRLVLIASRHSKPEFPPSSHGPGKDDYATVWDWIGDLPPIAAGETHPDIPNHVAANLSPINLKRIMATPPGDGRLVWPSELKLACHSGDYKGHTDVYGRIRKDYPASGLTTRCISLSNGRFGHPLQHRALSVREAACLQTFPRKFIFHGSMTSAAKQVGNAVPPLLAQRFGKVFIDCLSVSAGG